MHRQATLGDVGRRITTRVGVVGVVLVLLVALNVVSGSGNARAQPQKPSVPNSLVTIQDRSPFTVTAWQEGDVECGEGCIDYFDFPVYLTATSLTGINEYSRYYYGSPQQPWHTEVQETYQGVSVNSAYNYFDSWLIHSELDIYDSNGYYIATVGVANFGCAVPANSAYDCGTAWPYLDFYDYQGYAWVNHYEYIWVGDDTGWHQIWNATYGWYLTTFCHQSLNCW